MAVSNPYSQYGLRQEDIPGARAFEAFARKHRLPRTRVQQTFEWYARNRDAIPHMNVEAVVGSFLEEHEARWGSHELNAAAEFFDQAGSRGYDSFMPSASDSQKRLDEIRQIRRNDPDSYNADMEAEELALLEHREETAFAEPAPAAPASRPARPAQTPQREPQAYDNPPPADATDGGDWNTAESGDFDAGGDWNGNSVDENY